jgi:hypothetical protein
VPGSELCVLTPNHLASIDDAVCSRPGTPTLVALQAQKMLLLMERSGGALLSTVEHDLASIEQASSPLLLRLHYNLNRCPLSCLRDCSHISLLGIRRAGSCLLLAMDHWGGKSRTELAGPAKGLVSVTIRTGFTGRVKGKAMQSNTRPALQIDSAQERGTYHSPWPIVL